jgi:uncharacterized HAD superfamily protein
MSLHIALDIDGVLANFVDALLPHVSEVLGREVLAEHITEYSIVGSVGMPIEVWAELWERLEDRMYHEAQPYPGVVEGLTELSALGRLSIQTSRPDKAEPATRVWLAKHLPHAFDVSFRSGRPKFVAVDEVDYFIDDSLDVVLAAERGTPIIVDRPWNRRDAPAHVRRVATLTEAAAVIEADVARPLARST